MAMACTVCTRDDRFEIDRELAQGKSKEGIARRYGLDGEAVRRHSRTHLAPEIARAASRARIANAGTCLQTVRRIMSRALEVLDEASGVDGITKAVTAATNAARLLGQVTGEVKQDVFMVFLQAHGIKSEAELKEIVQSHRAASSALSVEDCERDGVALLRWVISQQPDRLPHVLLGIQGAKLIPDATTGSNGTPSLSDPKASLPATSPAPGTTAPGGNGSGGATGVDTREG